MDPATGQAIRPQQVYMINPDVIYEVAGSGLPYREKGLTREQVWDKEFERKTALALKEALEEEDPKAMELPRVIRDMAGKDVSEWEALYQLSDGELSNISLKLNWAELYQAHIDSQLNRLSRSLMAMGKDNRARLYLAAYYWPDDEVSYARSKGYGIIQPNGSDLTIHFKAKELNIK
ncbi:hypothetical protein D9615_005084 [Tricholomella constricta]|uniref:Uncharacterized protein n=1 Tax=Tricholomella constricta TaxID=117010 RepID=A0A8H5HGS9_9AGAR|nr:hypothetical protein D9615_005084 [Tricholomella constricta]